jgi:hypothetical protein
VDRETRVRGSYKRDETLQIQSDYINCEPLEKREMKALEDGLKGTLVSPCTIIREGVEILQVFQLQSQNKE